MSMLKPELSSGHFSSESIKSSSVMESEKSVLKEDESLKEDFSDRNSD